MSEIQQRQIRELTEMSERFRTWWFYDLMTEDECRNHRQELAEEIEAIAAGRVYSGGVYDPNKTRKWGR